MSHGPSRQLLPADTHKPWLRSAEEAWLYNRQRWGSRGEGIWGRDEGVAGMSKTWGCRASFPTLFSSFDPREYDEKERGERLWKEAFFVELRKTNLTVTQR